MPEMQESRRRDSNPQPQLYESCALPLSYVGQTDPYSIAELFACKPPISPKNRTEELSGHPPVRRSLPKGLNIRGILPTTDSLLVGDEIVTTDKTNGNIAITPLDCAGIRLIPRNACH